MNNHSFCYKEKLNYFPASDPALHTMYYGLNDYVMQKLPVLEILNTINNKQTIEIHGIYPEHAVDILSGNSYLIHKEMKFYHIPYIKIYNFIRPKFCVAVNPGGQKVFIVAVTPGRDYVYHYAGLIRQYLKSHTSNYNNLYNIFRYPRMELTISSWTFLKSFVTKGDKVIIGYVNEMQWYLEGNIKCLLITMNDNDYYTSKCYRLKNNQVVKFLALRAS